MTAIHAAHQFVDQTRDPAASIHAAVISSGRREQRLFSSPHHRGIATSRGTSRHEDYAIVRLLDGQSGTDTDLIVLADKLSD